MQLHDGRVVQVDEIGKSDPARAGAGGKSARLGQSCFVAKTFYKIKILEGLPGKFAPKQKKLQISPLNFPRKVVIHSKL